MELAHGSWNVLHLFREAGVAGYATLLVALLAAGFGMVAAAVSGLGPKSAGPVLATLALVGTAFVLAAGLVGERYNLGRMHDAVAHVNACDRDMILFYGSHEARQCIRIALLLAIVPGLLAMLSSVIAVVRSQGGFGLVAGGVVLALAAVGADAAMLNRPYEGRDLHGAPRDVLCRVFQADPLTESCATELTEVPDEDLAQIRALPEYDPKKFDACIALTLAGLKPDAPEKVTDAVQGLSQAKLLDDAQRQRCADALAKWKLDETDRKNELRKLIAKSAIIVPIGPGGSIPDVLDSDDPSANFGGGGAALNPEADAHQPRLKGSVSRGEATSVGGLNRDVIQRILRAHAAQQRFCYDKALQRNPSLAGKLVVTFAIAPSGDVASVNVSADSTLQDEAMRACLVGRLQRVAFPPSDGVTQVTYPFTFTLAK